MSKKLVAYFSAEGTTKKVAAQVAEAAGADLYEIKPEVAYTKADLNWMDKNARSTVEMNDKAFRPALADKDAQVENYDEILIGFPIWWYVAPTIINTFLESYDFSGKTIVPFATSGGSDIADAAELLKRCCSAETMWKPGKRFGNYNMDILRQWIDTLEI